MEVSGPAVRAYGLLPDPRVYPVTVPPVVTLAALVAFDSATHRLPSGPTVIPRGWLLAVIRVYSVMVPLVVILATLLVAFSVNHRLPSGPAAISVGELAAVVTVYS